MQFPAKITSRCIWVAIPIDGVILHWFACGSDGRAVGQTYGHAITKISRMGRLPHFLRYRATLARGASLKNISNWGKFALSRVLAVRFAPHLRWRASLQAS